MIDYREICAICGKTCDVKNHIKEHGLTTKQYYDNQKIKLCEDVGYKLIRIKELYWLNDNINTKNFIKNLINEVKV